MIGVTSEKHCKSEASQAFSCKVAWETSSGLPSYQSSTDISVVKDKVGDLDLSGRFDDYFLEQLPEVCAESCNLMYCLLSLPSVVWRCLKIVWPMLLCNLSLRGSQWQVQSAATCCHPVIVKHSIDSIGRVEWHLPTAGKELIFWSCNDFISRGYMGILGAKSETWPTGSWRSQKRMAPLAAHT